MGYYRQVGDVPRKRHTVHHGRDGTVLTEELIGSDGFSADSALLYHRHAPSELIAIEQVAETPLTLTANLPLSPWHLRTMSLDDDGDGVDGVDGVRDRVLLLGNDAVHISIAHAARSSDLYRNAAADELVYVQSGDAVIESVFGPLAVHSGDYLVLPRGTTHRWVIESEPVRALVVECRGHVNAPRRYLSANGQFLEHAPYCERDLRAPTEPIQCEGDAVGVLVRTRAGLSCHVYRHHPFDVVGWDGALYPYALSIHDFEPIVGRVHQPPPVHQTFEAPGLVVCSFVPRPYDFHPESVKVPYHHSNVDSDEVLFYSAGQFASRSGSGIGVGSITLHPAGFVHGPQPGSRERVVDKDRTDELAVMVDTFQPLMLTERARAIGDPDYLNSWTAR
jgi:homogentisate 1,2-dioxygenase